MANLRIVQSVESEIHTRIYFIRSKRVSLANGLDIKWVLKSPSPKKQLKIQTHGRHFVKNYLKSRQKCLDIEWFGFQMVRTIKAEFQTFLDLNARISNPPCNRLSCKTNVTITTVSVKVLYFISLKA